MCKMKLILFTTALLLVTPLAAYGWSFGCGSDKSSSNRSTTLNPMTSNNESLEYDGNVTEPTPISGDLSHNYTNSSNLDSVCTLNLPKAIKEQKEITGKPLKILIDMEVLGVRDIPNEGGSFGVDIR